MGISRPQNKIWEVETGKNMEGINAFIRLIEVIIIFGLGYLCTMKFIPKLVTSIMAKYGFKMSPITKKRIARFKTIRRGYYSFVIIVTLIFLSLFLEFMVNNKPLVISYNDKMKFPAVVEWVNNVLFIKNISFFNKQSEFGQIGDSEVDYRLFQKYSKNPDLLKLDIEIKKFESGGQTDKDMEFLEQAYQNFKTKRHFIIMPLYPYSPYEHLLDQEYLKVTPAFLKDMEEKGVEKSIIQSLETLTGYKITKRSLKNIEGDLGETVIKGLQPIMNKEFNTVTEIEGAMDNLSLSSAEKELILKNSESENFTETTFKEALFRLNIPTAKIILILKNVPRIALRPPNPPSLEHPLGTDDSGLDVIPQLLYGFRISLLFSLLVTFVGNCIGVTVGAIMGYYGGWIDILTQRFIEIWASIPFLFTIMIIASIVQPKFILLAILLIILRAWLGITYTIRGEFYREKAKDYVQAADSIGVSNIKIMLKHILPNALVPIVTYAPFEIVAYIGSLVSLDYLGFGLPPGTPSWGALLSQGMQHIRYYPHLIIVPSATFALTLFAVVMIGEAVREAFDPKVFSRLR